MSLAESITRLREFRDAFDGGQIYEEIALTTDDLDLILGVLEQQPGIPIYASWDATGDVLGAAVGNE